VANLDWPSKTGLPVSEQQFELKRLLTRASDLNLNVIIFQVRPGCDTFFKSSVEPWSEFLTGQMGKAPEPFYDPLTFAVEQAHRRGLELHAWFNPFRVRPPTLKGGPAANYIPHVHPDWVRHYGSQLWLDPGLKTVREYATQTILDVVKRYDIDGVHLDDYFYPYPEKNWSGQLLDFPDDSSWQKYLAGGGKLSRADWRRKNIDDFVENLNRRIKAEKGWVKLGISPFGIWKLKFPLQVTKGLDAYEYLYADSRRWLVDGWVDYLVPQLYWSMAGPDPSFSALLPWWAAQNPKSRLLCAGDDATKVGSKWPASEIAQQIRFSRKQRGVSGNVLWNASTLLKNDDHLTDTLATSVYPQPALVPAMPWLGDKAPPTPKLQVEPSNASKPGKATWTSSGSDEVSLWVYQARVHGKWTVSIFPREKTSQLIPTTTSRWYPDFIAVTPVSRLGTAGSPVVSSTHPVSQPQKTHKPPARPPTANSTNHPPNSASPP
jgi:uncharacterized lipoprotein YddW (UPF0748 family)